MNTKLLSITRSVSTPLKLDITPLKLDITPLKLDLSAIVMCSRN